MPRICCKRNGHWTTFLGSEGTENKRPAPTASTAGTYMSVGDIGNTLQCQLSNRFTERGGRAEVGVGVEKGSTGRVNPQDHIPHPQVQLAFAWHNRPVLDRRMCAVSWYSRCSLSALQGRYWHWSACSRCGVFLFAPSLVLIFDHSYRENIVQRPLRLQQVRDTYSPFPHLFHQKDSLASAVGEVFLFVFVKVFKRCLTFSRSHGLAP